VHSQNKEWHGLGKRLNRVEIAAQPLRVGTGWVGVGFSGNGHDADDGEFLLTVVKEDLVSLVHGCEIFAGSMTSHAAHGETPTLHDLGPTGAKWGQILSVNVFHCI
jgi:hypothetical protein